MDKAPPSEADVLLRCLRDGWIDEGQARKARAEADRWRHAGSLVSIPTLLYGLGFIERSRALALEKEGSVAAPPAQVATYAVLERLGAGGMGEVFRAVDFDGRWVALKLLSRHHQANPESSRRFQREARLTRSLRHPHIVRTFASGKDGQYRWLAMELVSGPTLKHRIQGGGCLSEAHGLVLAAQIASAMRTAALAGVLHRDIKPANIILGSRRPGNAEPFCAKLCDFGLAKTWSHVGGDAQGSAAGVLTADGMSLGTPHYMSPEQATGRTDLDQRTDIYALGAVLFHSLTGSTVHDGEDSRMIMTNQAFGTIDFERLAANSISDPFVALLRRMLAKDRALRPADWEMLHADLHALTPEVLATVAYGDVAGSDRSSILQTVRMVGWGALLTAVFLIIGVTMWWILGV